MFRFCMVLALSLASSLAFASDPTALLTVGEADRMVQEANTIVTTSVGALAFFLGWVAGAST